MALETYNFPFFIIEGDNPESGTRVQLGGGYVFTSEPSEPDQRTFVLNYETMKFFVDPITGEVDETVNPTYNMYNLIKFYQRHKLYKSFHFYHPYHGQLECRFNKPLKEPKGMKNGNGAVEGFQVELIEIP